MRWYLLDLWIGVGVGRRRRNGGRIDKSTTSSASDGPFSIVVEDACLCLISRPVAAAAFNLLLFQLESIVKDG